MFTCDGESQCPEHMKEILEKCSSLKWKYDLLVMVYLCLQVHRSRTWPTEIIWVKLWPEGMGHTQTTAALFWPCWKQSKFVSLLQFLILGYVCALSVPGDTAHKAMPSLWYGSQKLLYHVAFKVCYKEWYTGIATHTSSSIRHTAMATTYSIQLAHATHEMSSTVESDWRQTLASIIPQLYCWRSIVGMSTQILCLLRHVHHAERTQLPAVNLHFPIFWTIFWGNCSISCTKFGLSCLHFSAPWTPNHLKYSAWITQRTTNGKSMSGLGHFPNRSDIEEQNLRRKRTSSPHLDKTAKEVEDKTWWKWCHSAQVSQWNQRRQANSKTPGTTICCGQTKTYEENERSTRTVS